MVGLVGLGRSGLLGFAGGQLGGAIDVVERQAQTKLASEVDELFRHVRRERLAALVVADVSLRTAQAFCLRLLRDAKVFADGLKVVHAPIVAALGCIVNSGDILPLKQRLQ